MQVAADFRYFASTVSAVKSWGSFSPYSALHTSQTAFAVQVAVPPVQLLVSVCEASRLQVRVCVPSSLDVQAPQLWSSALPEKKVASSAVPSELRPQTAQDL